MNNLSYPSRRDFLKLIAGIGTGIISCSKSKIRENLFLSDIGVCTSLNNHHILYKSGCTYIEEGVRRFLIPDEREDKFQEKLIELQESELPIYACSSFLPGSLKSVGPDISHEAILTFSETALKRAKQSGVKTIVFGSGSSRRIPDGFKKTEAKEQFINLLKRMAPVAGKYGVIISLEPLNSGETNFINTLTEGVEIVEAVNQPHIKLMVDIYHMQCEGEPAEEIIKAGRHIYHCHIAEKENRNPPGTTKTDFRPYFRSLKKVKYKGKISIECRWENMSEQLPPAIKELRKQISEI